MDSCVFYRSNRSEQIAYTVNGLWKDAPNAVCYLASLLA
jgi:hypothetical protein